MILDRPRRDRDFGGDQPERVERGFPGRPSGERGPGQRFDTLLPGHRIDRRLRVMPERLTVGQIVASAAPGVKQPRPFARNCVEQAAGAPEAFRALRDDFARRGDQRRTIDRGSGHPTISPAVALALPTTPGMPAPGWVPAPTK